MRDLITRLGRRVQRQSADDRGAVAVIVALLIAGGVLLGMAAVVIDVGQVYQERAELQNGADAAAIGVAKTCALGACQPTVATTYADGNASGLTGGTAGVPLVCGSGGLGPCPASTGAITDCPQPPPTGTNYVDVHTATLTASGSTLLPLPFAATLPGNSGDHGTAVHACAQAEWGPPTAATTVAIAMSACTWDQATQQGTSFPATPPYPPNPMPAPTADQVLKLNPGNGTGCASEPAGADGPGTFAWVAHSRGNCTVGISGSFAGRTRMGVSFSCLSLLENSQQNQTPILVPVYLSQNGPPGNPSYTLLGFADFVVTGYHLSSFDDTYADAHDWLNGANDCTGTTYCINGYFVQGVAPFTGRFGSTNLGVYVIQLTG
jgi:Flp pilus assembly protein TadG